MKRLPKMVLMAAGIWSAPASAQEEATHLPYGWPQNERRHTPETDRRLLPPRPSEDRSGDLWYGTPGVRPGGDLLVPIVQLIRNPAEWLDFRPRKVERFLPDRETAECFRDRW